MTFIGYHQYTSDADLLTNADVQQLPISASMNNGNQYNPTKMRHSILGERRWSDIPQSHDSDDKAAVESRHKPSFLSCKTSCSTSLIFKSPTLFPNSLCPVKSKLPSCASFPQLSTIWRDDTPSASWQETDLSKLDPRQLQLVSRPSNKSLPSISEAGTSKSRPKTIRSFNARLNSFAQKGNYADVLSLIEGVQNGSIEVTGPLNTYSYTILVKAYCNAGNLAAAQDLMAQMESYDPSQRPNRFTYNTLLNACVRWDDMKNALKLFAIMDASRDRDLQPDHVTYTTLMKGFAVTGEMELAQKLMERLRNHPDPKCRPNQVTYNTMLKGFTAIGDMDAADLLLKEMYQESEFQPDIVSMNTIIGGHTRKGDMSRAVAYAEMMTKAGLVANSVTYNALIEGYVRVDDMKSAQMLFDLLESGEVTDGSPSPLTYQTIIGGYLRQGDMAKAEELFKREKSKSDTFSQPKIKSKPEP